MDACVLSGSKCGQAAADAFCQYLGFDYNAPGLYSTVQATAPALSMTGWNTHNRLISSQNRCACLLDQMPSALSVLLNNGGIILLVLCAF